VCARCAARILRGKIFPKKLRGNLRNEKKKKKKKRRFCAWGGSWGEKSGAVDDQSDAGAIFSREGKGGEDPAPSRLTEKRRRRSDSRQEPEKKKGNRAIARPTSVRRAKKGKERKAPPTFNKAGRAGHPQSKGRWATERASAVRRGGGVRRRKKRGATGPSPIKNKIHSLPIKKGNSYNMTREQRGRTFDIAPI